MSVFHGDGEISISTNNAVLNWHPDTPLHIETKTYDAINDTFMTDYLSVSEVSQFLADIVQGMEDN